MPVELPSGTVTLLFTDIEGSTRMLQELGREAYVRALTEHRRLLREAFTSHGGVEVEMQGDSFHFAFPYARDAVAAAVSGQRALTEHAWESQPVHVRIGLHTGEPMHSDGLYAGLDVHRAARIMSAAHGGQVLLSERTADLVHGELGAGLRVVPVGEHRLKDLAQAQRLFQAVGEGLRSDFPPPKGSAESPIEVHQQSRAGLVLRPASAWSLAAVALMLGFAGVGTAWLVSSRQDAETSTATRSAPQSSQQETVAAAFTAVPVEPAPAPAAPAPTRLSGDTVGVIHSNGRRILAQIPVGPDPTRISIAPDAVWVAVGNNTIARIDPATRAMVAAVGTDNDVDDLAAGDDAVWVLAARPGSAPRLSRVETGTNVTAASVRVDVGLSRFGTEASRPAIAVGRGSVWVTDPYPPGPLRRVDTATMKVADAIALSSPGGPAITIDGGSVWVNAGLAQLAQVDARTRQVVGSAPISTPSARTGAATATRDRGGPIRLAAGQGSLWLVTHPATTCCPPRTFGTSTLQRIDPEDQVVSGVVPLEGFPSGVAVGQGAVWVGTREGNLFRIDPTTLAIRHKLELGHPIGGVAVGTDAVWVTLRSDGSG